MSQSDLKVSAVAQRCTRCGWCKSTWTMRARGVADGGRHRLCLAHWKKSKAKRARDLDRQAAGSMRVLFGLVRLEPRRPTIPAILTRLVKRYIG